MDMAGARLPRDQRIWRVTNAHFVFDILVTPTACKTTKQAAWMKASTQPCALKEQAGQNWRQRCGLFERTGGHGVYRVCLVHKHWVAGITPPAMRRHLLYLLPSLLLFSLRAGVTNTSTSPLFSYVCVACFTRVPTLFLCIYTW